MVRFSVSGNSTHLSLAKNKLKQTKLKHIHVKCKISVQQTLKLLRNREIRTFRQPASNRNVMQTVL